MHVPAIAELELLLIDEIRRTHAVHTLVLYGSHARGDATAESDLDVAGFSDDVAVTKRDARSFHGVPLDGFVHPTSHADVNKGLDHELLSLLGGRVLLDERGLAQPLLDALAACDERGPEPLAASEAQMRRVWAHKMLGRIRRDDLEARYRRHWLLYQLLEDYFALRVRWYRGPRLALSELARTAPAVFMVFERALAPEASLEALAELVEVVVHATEGDPGGRVGAVGATAGP